MLAIYKYKKGLVYKRFTQINLELSYCYLIYYLRLHNRKLFKQSFVLKFKIKYEIQIMTSISKQRNYRIISNKYHII